MAAGLDELGIGVGERVAMVSHNSARLLTALFGVSGSGRVLVPVNFRLVAAEVAYIVEHSGARLLLVDPELADALDGVECERKLIIGAESDAVLMKFDVEPKPWEPDEDATATINYTSGTTARPKGVQLTHRNVWINATTFGWHMGVSDRDVYLHTLPQFHCNGWGMLYAVSAMGGKHVIIRKIDGHEILRRVDEHGVTLICGAPAVLNAVLDAAAELAADGKPIPGRDRVRIVVAGAPPPTKTIERTEVELGWEFVQIYGLTETAPLITINRNRAEYDDLSPFERAQKLSRAGAPSIGTTMAVDAEGEILARSNTVMAGYWEQPDQTDAAIRDGFFHTGDGGIIDDDHYVVISDRKKDVIISGGENVSSIEVEDAIFQHPDVTEVAVIGIPDEKWGELVTALVVTDAGQRPRRGRVDRVHEGAPRRLQVPEAHRVPRRAGSHRDRQAPEVQAPRAVLGHRPTNRSTDQLPTFVGAWHRRTSTRGWRRWWCGRRCARRGPRRHTRPGRRGSRRSHPCWCC